MRILVADDTAFALDAIASFLEYRGHTVTTAVNGKDLVEKLGDGANFDAVITDNDMPVMTGLQALVEIKTNPTTERMPVIVLSAADVSVDARMLGGIYIEKAPGTHQRLFDELDKIARTVR